jgi:hypothetical protein
MGQETAESAAALVGRGRLWQTRPVPSESTTRDAHPPTAALLALLAASVAVSTAVHHRWPGLLHVPPLDGIPRATMGEMLAGDLFVSGLAALCFAHAWRRWGAFPATAFLVGSFAFTGVEETMWILLGRFGPTGTYYFTKGFFWFLETPVSACIGWFLLAYATMWVAERVWPDAPVACQAAVAGLIATDLDLWVDPVQTHPAFVAWVWAVQPGGIRVLSIPITNFIGWFLLIFLFALVFARLPEWVRRDGAGRASARFFGVLLALEVGILAFFTAYGTLEQVLVRPGLNVTVWGL